MLLEDLAAIAGLDPAAVGQDNLARAADQAMARLGLQSLEAYLDLIRGNPRELRLFMGQAVVQETWFFRDPEPFAELARLAPTLTQPLRLLCAPCATGEEAYSMAMTLFAAGPGQGQFAIDAVDVNPQALETARAGCYPPTSFRRDLGRYQDFFRQHGPCAQVDPAVARTVRFHELNILDDPGPALNPPYSIIFCRNLLIYLAKTARQRLADNLRRLMAPRAVLFTSAAEIPVLARLGFTPCPNHRISACQMAGAPPRTPPGGIMPPGPPRIAGREQPGRSAQAAPGPRTRGSGAPIPQDSGIGHGSLATVGLARGPGRAKSNHFPQRGGAGGAKPPALEDQARAMADAGRLEEALELIQSGLARSPDSAGLYHLLGLVRLGAGDTDEAEAALRRALYLEPGHLEALRLLEVLCQVKGREGQAELLAKRARRVEDSPEASS